MVTINTVHLGGNLTRDPELKYTPGGAAVCEFAIAVNEKWTDQRTNEKREEVSFIECVAWARGAEVIAEYMRKGSSIYVSGKLKQDRWDDKSTGQKRSKIRVTVRDFQFLGGGQGASQEQPAEAPQQDTTF